MGSILIGHLLRPFGVNGEIKVSPLTSFPEERFVSGKKVTLKKKGRDDFSTSFLNVRGSKAEPIVLLEGIGNPEDAFSFKGYGIYLDEKDAPLPEGYYRFEDLKGLSVINEEGKVLGKVDDVYSFSSVPSVRCISNGGKTFYFPFLFDEFVIEVNLEGGYLKIKERPGLL